MKISLFHSFLHQIMISSYFLSKTKIMTFLLMRIRNSSNSMLPLLSSSNSSKSSCTSTSVILSPRYLTTVDSSAQWEGSEVETKQLFITCYSNFKIEKFDSPRCLRPRGTSRHRQDFKRFQRKLG